MYIYVYIYKRRNQTLFFKEYNTCQQIESKICDHHK